MIGKLEEYPGQLATKTDWMNHLGNIYPEVKQSQGSNGSLLIEKSPFVF